MSNEALAKAPRPTSTTAIDYDAENGDWERVGDILARVLGPILERIDDEGEVAA